MQGRSWTLEERRKKQGILGSLGVTEVARAEGSRTDCWGWVGNGGRETKGEPERNGDSSKVPKGVG